MWWSLGKFGQSVNLSFNPFSTLNIWRGGGHFANCDCWLWIKLNYVAMSDVIWFYLKLTFCLVSTLSHGCSTHRLQPWLSQVEGVAVALVRGQCLLKNICNFPSIKNIWFCRILFPKYFWYKRVAICGLENDWWFFIKYLLCKIYSNILLWFVTFHKIFTSNIFWYNFWA